MMRLSRVSNSALEECLLNREDGENVQTQPAFGHARNSDGTKRGNKRFTGLPKLATVERFGSKMTY
jgi:hypothetical protein